LNQGFLPVPDAMAPTPEVVAGEALTGATGV
jgi:hypothetical protein